MFEIREEKGSLPKYLQLREWLREMIKKGRYSIGERLPSEVALSRMFGVNRNTVRHALLQLLDDGLIVKKNGVGTFVSANTTKKVLYSLQNIISLSSELSKLGFKSRAETLSKNVVTATDDIAEKLMLGSDRQTIEIIRVRYGNDIPLVLERCYYSYKEYKEILEMDIPDSLNKVLIDKFGVVLEHSVQTLSSISLPEKDAELLEVESGFPATLQESIIYDNNNIAVELLHSSYRGDKFVFKVESGRFSTINIP
ncbi:MAG: GntR family transcriptional regulator [Spirochaetes bacterium]|nr:GntR family transcriptional regulator [Spirochaetota bacterium]